jgi:hypothetical protein
LVGFEVDYVELRIDRPDLTKRRTTSGVGTQAYNPQLEWLALRDPHLVRVRLETHLPSADREAPMPPLLCPLFSHGYFDAVANKVLSKTTADHSRSDADADRHHEPDDQSCKPDARIEAEHDLDDYDGDYPDHGTHDQTHDPEQLLAKGYAVLRHWELHVRSATSTCSRTYPSKSRVLARRNASGDVRKRDKRSGYGRTD